MRKTYSEKLRDPRWHKKRLEILNRDEWMSKFATSNTLHVHHRRYVRGAEPWDIPNKILITLCESCHQEETILMRKNEELLVAIIKEKFFGKDLEVLANAFTKLGPLFSPGATANAIEFAFSDLDKLIDEYFEDTASGWLSNG